ncbi:cuticle protein 64-like [Vanessa cardui]|uniref:cuticle protein 64-like n=1 Tax=Vanessa cardui TaxID=171605 RepID=UPI001F133AE8|nr:cuticle protein 64-like [Vanessa cardui]
MEILTLIDTLRLKKSSKMNTFITLACLVAVAVSAHASGLGYGYGGYGGYGSGYSIAYSAPILAPAISTANVYKAAPIPIIKSVVTPIISAPIIKTVPIASYSLGGLDGYGGYGLLGGYGGYGLGYGKGLGYGYGYGLGKH